MKQKVKIVITKEEDGFEYVIFEEKGLEHASFYTSYSMFLRSLKEEIEKNEVLSLVCQDHSLRLRLLVEGIIFK